MVKRVFIIHGWDGFPEEGWFPWLKKELESNGYNVTIPSMPKPNAPQIDAWVSRLRDVVGQADKHTYFIGHSIGCQTIIRYLESLSGDVSIGGAVFVAGWTHLTPEATPDDESRSIAKPWIEKTIDWTKVKPHTNNFVAVFSDNDPLVPLEEKEVFSEKLGAKIIVSTNKGHFSGEDGVEKLPIVLEELSRMGKLN